MAIECSVLAFKYVSNSFVATVALSSVNAIAQVLNQSPRSTDTMVLIPLRI